MSRAISALLRSDAVLPLLLACWYFSCTPRPGQAGQPVILVIAEPACTDPEGVAVLLGLGAVLALLLQLGRQLDAPARAGRGPVSIQSRVNGHDARPPC